MHLKRMCMGVVAALLLATPARAELRHVEIKTLGMD